MDLIIFDNRIYNHEKFILRIFLSKLTLKKADFPPLL